MSKRLNETVNRFKPILFLLILLFSNLSVVGYSDEIGNLFKTKEQTDRQYGRVGQLLNDETYSYSYDEVGNLIEKESITEKWRYQWSQGGMFKKVIRPDKKHVDFTYDALGRRLTKTYKEETTHFVWDGNVPLHEWASKTEETILSVGGTLSRAEMDGELKIKIPENLTTWVFEDGTFIPMAKLKGENSYSIITDHLGTPTEAYDEEGEKVWSCQLDIYGKIRKIEGERSFISFRYQGQYEDSETGLYYNRHRYFDPNSGTYISQDPIGVISQELNFYAYVADINAWTDPFGLGKVCVKASKKKSVDIELRVRKAHYPQTTGHISTAIKAGKAKKVTIRRAGAKANRRKSLKGIKTKKGKDRDEWPMAMFKEGGTGASVKHIDPSDNRGAGSAIGSALSSYPDGTVVEIFIIP